MSKVEQELTTQQCIELLKKFNEGRETIFNTFWKPPDLSKLILMYKNIRLYRQTHYRPFHEFEDGNLEKKRNPSIDEILSS